MTSEKAEKSQEPPQDSKEAIVAKPVKIVLPGNSDAKRQFDEAHGVAMTASEKSEEAGGS